MATTTRSGSTRARKTKEVHYVPPNVLDVDEGLRDWFLSRGMKLRWIRHSVSGRDDTKNMIKKEREGWVPVTNDELPEEYQTSFEVGGHGKTEGIVVNNDVMLAKIPVEMAQARQDYYEQLSMDQEDGVNRQLMQNSSRSMPILNESRSTTTRGRKPANFGGISDSNED